MAKGYWITTYRQVRDPEALAAYAKLAVPALLAAGGRVLVRGMPAKVYESGVEQRVDQRAEWHGPYRIHRTLPASLVTETAEASILIGLEGRGKTGLSYRFGHLHVDVHAFCAPFRHAPHRQVCRTEAPRTSSAGSRCSCSVSARRTAAQ